MHFLLILFELKLFLKVRILFVSLLAIQILGVIITPFLLDEAVSLYGTHVVSLLLSMGVLLTYSNNLTQDQKDGSLSQRFLIFSPLEIILAKYIAIFILMCLTILILSFAILLLYSVEINMILYFFLSNILMTMITISIAICSSVIKLYFANQNEYLSVIMMPILIPVLILLGLAISLKNYFFLALILGVSLVVVPITIFLSSYLLKKSIN